jgi:methionine sulfoxide reductase heme-binding subunit
MATIRDRTTAAPIAHNLRTTSADAWMAEEVRLFGRYVKRQTIALCVLGAPAFLPIFFALPGIITRNGTALGANEADVLGSGSEILLLCTLLVTPLMTVTRQRWFFPLRRWYGLVMACTAFTDAAVAAVTTSFAGGVFGRLAGHSFLLVGFVNVMVLVPLFLTGNNRAQRWLGRYWRPLHRLTYVVWGLLVLHLTLLAGLGFQNGTNGPGSGIDGTPVMHQRVYQILACSLFPFMLRLPPVKRWVDEKQKEGRGIVVFWAVLPMILLFLVAFAYIVHEEIFKGLKLVTLNTNDNG